jgi:hypothetical protein
LLYRRKLLLALLQKVNGTMEKLRLQKLLFLLTRQQAKPVYDFIPYKFGCYSFSASADLKAMEAKGQVKVAQSHFYCTEKTNYQQQLKARDQNLLDQLMADYGGMNTDALIKHTYLNFPYYAINSQLVDEVLDEQLIDRVDQQRPEVKEITLYTIGYEGRSLETYLNTLLKHGVKLLIDTRKNAVSRKFGFSKRQLERYCNNIGIQYYHLPETGILSSLRTALQSQEDYDQLFQRYKNYHLPETLNAQEQILDWLKQYQQVALTCFEAHTCQCHRKPLAEAIQNLSGFKYHLKHL